MSSTASRPPRPPAPLPADPWSAVADRARSLRQELHAIYLDALSVAEVGPASNPSTLARSTMKQRVTASVSDSASALANLERLARNESGRIEVRR